jgi:molybdate transport system ATP-binding protein
MLKISKKVNGFSLDVSWEIGNEMAVLFGYSGAGKSLTLQMIAGLMEPNRGIIRLNGEIFYDSLISINLSPQQRSIGYVFQDLALFPHMTVKGNILYGAKGMDKNIRMQKCAELINAFGLKGLEDKLPSEISGGQKQRVAFARALIRRPKMLLLDEPFSALDAPLRMEMRNFLKDIRAEFNIPVVLVTHDLTEAFTMADRLIIYSNGKAVQSGTPTEIYNNPENQDVKRLVKPFCGECSDYS